MPLPMNDLTMVKTVFLTDAPLVDVSLLAVWKVSWLLNNGISSSCSEQRAKSSGQTNKDSSISHSHEQAPTFSLYSSPRCSVSLAKPR